jgi:hypothetical protein
VLLSSCIVALIYSCIVVMLYCCIVVLLSSYIGMLMYCCIVVMLYCCLVVLLSHLKKEHCISLSVNTQYIEYLHNKTHLNFDTFHLIKYTY